MNDADAIPGLFPDAESPAATADLPRAFAAKLPAGVRESRPVKVLEASLEKGRLAHAILLHGDDPEALEMVALALSAALLDCETVAVRQHPDLHTLRPSGKSRQIRIGDRGDAAENTMRHFLHGIHQTPNRGLRKAAIVFDADRMNAATANAFLKTLEEPPGNTTLLLLTARPYDLLDTIRSRCFNFRLPPLKDAGTEREWTDWLQRFQAWLGVVQNAPRQASEVAHTVMELYGLVVSFQTVLTQLSDARWEREKSALPPGLPDEQQAAMEAGVRKGTRQRLFADIEHAALGFAKGQLSPENARHLARTVTELEHAALLAEVFNMKEDAALEAFLLACLRIWSQA